MHSLVPQLVATLGATLGAFGLGMVLAWTATALPQIEEEEWGGAVAGAGRQGWLVSIWMLGAAAVPFLTAIAFPRIGKKW